MAFQLLKVPTTALRSLHYSLSTSARASNTLRLYTAPICIPIRSFTSCTPALYPRKGAEDKDSIDREPTEYSKSGTDDQAAAQEEAAFDPHDTNPESQKKTAGEGNEGRSNPLDVSPANPEVSKQRSTTEGGPENSSRASSGGTATDRGRTSGGGSPKKGKQVS